MFVIGMIARNDFLDVQIFHDINEFTQAKDLTSASGIIVENSSFNVLLSLFTIVLTPEKDLMLVNMKIVGNHLVM